MGRVPFTIDDVGAQPLDERLQMLEESDLEMIRGERQPLGAFDNSFDNSFDNVSN